MPMVLSMLMPVLKPMLSTIRLPIVMPMLGPIPSPVHGSLNRPGSCASSREQVPVDAERDAGIPCPMRLLIGTTSRPSAISAAPHGRRRDVQQTRHCALEHSDPQTPWAGCRHLMEVAMAVTLETPVTSLRASISVWFANGYARLMAARQAQADARVAQYLKDVGLEARKQTSEN